MALKDHKCKLTTVKKWEKELNCNLEYDIIGADVAYDVQFVNVGKNVQKK